MFCTLSLCQNISTQSDLGPVPYLTTFAHSYSSVQSSAVEYCTQRQYPEGSSSLVFEGNESVLPTGSSRYALTSVVVAAPLVMDQVTGTLRQLTCSRAISCATAATCSPSIDAIHKTRGPTAAGLECEPWIGFRRTALGKGISPSAVRQSGIRPAGIAVVRAQGGNIAPPQRSPTRGSDRLLTDLHDLTASIQWLQSQVYQSHGIASDSEEEIRASGDVRVLRASPEIKGRVDRLMERANALNSMMANYRASGRKAPVQVAATVKV